MLICENDTVDYFKTVLHMAADLGTDTHLFVTVLRLGDSEVTFSVFESSCHQLLPV